MIEQATVAERPDPIGFCNNRHRAFPHLQISELGPCQLVVSMPTMGIARSNMMAWTTPVLVEICIGLEINGYLPAEF
jgi:coenzyme PQQ precursor peptide PqqA